MVVPKKKWGGLDLKKNFFVLLTALLVVAGYVAAVPEGATVSSVSNDTSTPAGAGNTDIFGGYIYNATLSGQSQTELWAAAYGNASGNVTLRNGAGTKVYNWLVSVAQGQMYATRNAGVPAWASITTANASCIDPVFGYTTTWTDSALNTFTSASTAITVGPVSVASDTAASAFTYNNSGSPFWETISLADQAPNYALAGCGLAANNFVFTGILRNNQPAYDGSTADYQILLPENERGSSAATAYYFYLELR